MPQDRGTRDNEIITVGAIYPDGTLWEGGSPRGVRVGPQGTFVQTPDNALLSSYPDSRLGWIDIYAPGFQILVPSSHDGDVKRIGGTSISTALVVSTLSISCFLFPSPNKMLICLLKLKAGLAAYFLALPENEDRFAWSVDKNNAMSWGLRMKQYMTTLSYQWNDAPGGGIRANMPPLPFNTPSEVNVAYNGAYGPMNSESIPEHPPWPQRDLYKLRLVLLGGDYNGMVELTFIH